MNRRSFITTSSALFLSSLLGCEVGDINLPSNNNQVLSNNSSTSLSPLADTQLKKIVAPPQGKLYHGVYPGTATCTGSEDDIQSGDLDSYQKAVGAEATWVYFSNNWTQRQEFPEATAKWMREAGSVPFIRLMLRSRTNHNTLKIKYNSEGCEEITGKCNPEAHNDKITCNFENKYTLDFIRNDQKTRDDLLRWGEKAAKFGSPLIVEWGTEMNGFWFAWNGWWNGKAEGAEKFKEVYRYIYDLITVKSGAKNITWVFHVNYYDSPNVEADPNAPQCVGWNKFENYYPGDFIDWLGVSVYGAQNPSDGYCTPFNDSFASAYERLAALTPAKPIMLLEFGVTMNNKKCGKEPTNCAKINSGAANWANAALTEILTNKRYKERLRGFSWWNECWENSEGGNTNMRVQDVPCLKEVFQKKFAENRNKIITRPTIQLV